MKVLVTDKRTKLVYIIISVCFFTLLFIGYVSIKEAILEKEDIQKRLKEITIEDMPTKCTPCTPMTFPSEDSDTAYIYYTHSAITNNGVDITLQEWIRSTSIS